MFGPVRNYFSEQKARYNECVTHPEIFRYAKYVPERNDLTLVVLKANGLKPPSNDEPRRRPGRPRRSPEPCHFYPSPERLSLGPEAQSLTIIAHFPSTRSRNRRCAFLLDLDGGVRSCKLYSGFTSSHPYPDMDTHSEPTLAPRPPNTGELAELVCWLSDQ